MSILQKLENDYSNLIKNIKKCENKEQKLLMIGSLAMDIGEGCISSLAKVFCLSRQTIRKAIKFSIGQITYKPILETRGRKKLIEIFPEIKQDIENIISTYLSIKHELKDETLYVRLSIKEIKSKLIETGKYDDSSFSNSYLNNLVNEMGYNLKKVKKTKPLKK